MQLISLAANSFNDCNGNTRQLGQYSNQATSWTAGVLFPAEKDFYLRQTPTATLGPTQPPVHRVLDRFLGRK